MNEKLFGTYKLSKYGYTFKKENKFEPISEWYSGAIHYSETGYMNVIVRFAQKPQSFSDFVSYLGTYTVKGNEIIHQVTESVRPEYEGQTLTRQFKFENDELIVEFENTEEFIKFASWKRV
jgi:hypothetical protein